MKSLKVKDIMATDLIMVQPNQTIEDAARLMKENDVGILPVGTPKAVKGVITDRDIIVRVIAEGRSVSHVTVQDAMTSGHIVCNEGDSLEHAAELMHKHDVSRVLVADFDTITGIVTIADLMRNVGSLRESDKVLHTLLRPIHRKKKVMASAQKQAACFECDSYDEVL